MRYILFLNDFVTKVAFFILDDLTNDLKSLKNRQNTNNWVIKHDISAELF